MLGLRHKSRAASVLHSTTSRKPSGCARGRQPTTPTGLIAFNAMRCNTLNVDGANPPPVGIMQRMPVPRQYRCKAKSVAVFKGGKLLRIGRPQLMIPDFPIGFTEKIL